MDEAKQICKTTLDLELSAVESSDNSTFKGIWKGEGFKPLAIISGKMSEADIINANGFLIPLQEWKDMLEANMERIKKGQCFMTIAHDERPYEDCDWRDSIIVGIITDMWIEGKDVFFTVNVCSNDAGRNLMGIIGAGGYIQASTRLGIVPRKDEATGADCLVGKDSIIYGVDLVLDPAIESTWLEFKAASKGNKEENIEVSSADITQISKNLDMALDTINKEIQYEQEFYNSLKEL